MYITGKGRIKVYKLSLMENNCGGKSPGRFFFVLEKEPSSKKRENKTKQKKNIRLF